MQTSNSDEQRSPGQRPADFPALVALRLTAGDLDALASQGFVCAEQRGGRTYYKLRFRQNGQQVVRYIGDAERAAVVKQELSTLQAASKAARDLKMQAKLANQMLRESKRILEPVLRANGFVFHGLAIRRPRQRKSETNTNATP